MTDGEDNLVLSRDIKDITDMGHEGHRCPKEPLPHPKTSKTATMLTVVTRPPVLPQPDGRRQTPSLHLMRRPGFEAMSRMASGTLQGPIEMVSMMIGWCP